MNKDDIFEKFINNPKLREKVTITESQLNQVHLYSDISDRLIDVIRTTILYLDDSTSLDIVARRVNQSFKKENVIGQNLFFIEDK